MPKTHSAPYLIAQAATVFIASGSSPQEAETVASNLVMANLSGHDSHGIGMLPRYVDAVLEGGLIPNASVATLLDIGSMLTLNGQRGYGQVVGEQAMALGMARAKKHGSCIMTLANAHHLGRIGHFAEMAVVQGLVSIHFVNVLSRPVVAPWGGSDGRFGTNPFCVGIPVATRQSERSDGPPLASSAPQGGSAVREATSVRANSFILDFATSAVAHGKMRVAHNQGQQVKPGLLMDEHGLPTTNPSVVMVPQPGGLMGALMVFGEHKGYGLAVACELLGGALTGNGTWRGPASGQRAVVNGMLTILIDPARLGTQAAFGQEAAAFIDWIKQSPVANGFDAVKMAGDAERLTRIERQRDGIEVDDQTWQEIVAAGKKVGVTL